MKVVYTPAAVRQIENQIAYLVLKNAPGAAEWRGRTGANAYHLICRRVSRPLSEGWASHS
jgi:hypothetical protein